MILVLFLASSFRCVKVVLRLAPSCMFAPYRHLHWTAYCASLSTSANRHRPFGCSSFCIYTELAGTHLSPSLGWATRHTRARGAYLFKDNVHVHMVFLIRSTSPIMMRTSKGNHFHTTLPLPFLQCGHLLHRCCLPLFHCSNVRFFLFV